MAKNTKKEQFNYLVKIFPLIDLPFGILSVIYSKDWLFTLCCLPVFPIVALTCIKISEKKGWQPGPLVLSLNGTFFYYFVYRAGIGSPSWPMMINVVIATSLMFNKQRVGQVIMGTYVLLFGIYFYWLGAALVYSMAISFSLLAFLILFVRIYDYLQVQQINIEEKNKEIELQHKDITDSINYAKKIQYAVLPLRESIYRSIPLSFIYYKPKDVVSGDFFWFHEIDKDNYVLVCADCTGHGVPGAFMTVIGSSLLNQIVIEDKIHQPAKILSELDRRIVMTLKQEKEKTLTVQDGMDLSLIKVNKANKEVVITGAKRPVIFIRDKQMTEHKGSKSSLGGMRSDEKIFNEIKLNYEEDDVLYFYTDGFTDQFGGVKGKKFSSKRLKEQFLSIHHLTVQDQNKKLEGIMDEWKGELEQVDDMLVMGIKF